jgi:hypothetical protein
VARNGDGVDSAPSLPTLGATLEATPATVTLASTAPQYTRVSPIPVTVTFSKPVLDFTAQKLVVANATVSGFAGSGATYSFNLVPAGQGAITVDVPEETVHDASGTGNTAAPRLTRVYDTVAPGIAIGAPSAISTATGPVSYTLTYTGADTITLSPADITLTCTTGNAAGTFELSGTGSTRTVTLTGLSGRGKLVIRVAAGTAQDTAGNTAPAAGPSKPVAVYEGPHAPADVNGDLDINALDVQLVINGALGKPTPGDLDINHSGKVDALDVQAVINGALGRTF